MCARNKTYEFRRNVPKWRKREGESRFHRREEQSAPHVLIAFLCSDLCREKSHEIAILALPPRAYTNGPIIMI